MGFGLSLEETGHGKLQCDRDFASQLLPLHALTAIMYDRDRGASIDHGADPKHPEA